MIVFECTRCLRLARNHLRNMANFTTNRQMSSISSETKSYLIVGLGNADLPKSRHSVGMRVVDRLADWLDVRWARNRQLLSMVASSSLCDPALHLILIKPKVAMNINGKSIQRAAEYFRIEPSCIYLLHDELDKRVGVARMKEGGSPRGHNGVRSAISHLKTDVMPRLLIGIDRPTNKNNVADYVLDDFTREEVPIVEDAIKDGLQKLLRHIQNNSDISHDLVNLIMAGEEDKGSEKSRS